MSDKGGLLAGSQRQQKGSSIRGDVSTALKARRLRRSMYVRTLLGTYSYFFFREGGGVCVWDKPAATLVKTWSATHTRLNVKRPVFPILSWWENSKTMSIPLALLRILLHPKKPRTYSYISGKSPRAE